MFRSEDITWDIPGFLLGIELFWTPPMRGWLSDNGSLDITVLDLFTSNSWRYFDAANLITKNFISAFTVTPILLIHFVTVLWKMYCIVLNKCAAFKYSATRLFYIYHLRIQLSLVKFIMTSLEKVDFPMRASAIAC